MEGGSTIPANEMRLVLLGTTGAGKSSTGNTILANLSAFRAKAGGHSVTKECSYVRGFNLGKIICIVDTPGFHDTKMTEEEVTNEITRCVAISSPGPHGILYITRIGRFRKEEQQTINHFVNHFGEDMYRYMIVVFTGMDDLDHDGISIQSFLKDAHPVLLEIICKAGNRYIAFNNRSQHPQDQVQVLLKMIEELQVQNGGTFYTNEMYRRAEEQLRQEEAKKREEARKKKQAEIDTIRNQCMKELDTKMTKLNLEHEKKIAEMNDKRASMIKDEYELKLKLTEEKQRLKDEHHQHILSMEKNNTKQMQDQINTIQELHKKEMAEIREQMRASDSDQVQQLAIMIDKMVTANGGSFYTNEMYRQVEETLRQREEKKRIDAEAQKQIEINQIRAECLRGFELEKAKMQQAFHEDLKHMQQELAKASEEKHELRQVMTEKIQKLKDDHQQQLQQQSEDSQHSLMDQMAKIEESHSQQISSMREEMRRLIHESKPRGFFAQVGAFLETILPTVPPFVASLKFNGNRQ